MHAIRDRLLRAHGDAGMSLVEVVVAMVVLVIISTGVVATMVSVLSVGRDSRAREVAVNLAASEIDRARGTTDLAGFETVDRPPVPLNGDVFEVEVATQWVRAIEGTVPRRCGTVEGVQYASVNVRVTWGGMRPGAAPVSADTVVAPTTDHGCTASTPDVEVP